MSKGQIVKDNKTLTYVIQVKNNKNSYFRVKDGKVFITTNKYVTKGYLLDIVYKNFDQFYNQAKKQQKYIQTDYFYWFGKQLEINKHLSNEYAYFIVGNRIDIFYKDENKFQSYIYKVMEEELRKKVEDIEPTIQRQLDLVGLSLVPYKYKRVKSYFGKCLYLRKEIYLNIYLATLPQEILEYVMYHEYAHLLVPNHSKDFYKVLKTLMPNYQEVQNKLKNITF